mmetsp:Transcript_3533/g.4155  ORF Transcript_3533/g.4155 Transcript_3533/m.4155 type:complete len:150 (-) Transcript_3533:120-569(-)
MSSISFCAFGGKALYGVLAVITWCCCCCCSGWNAVLVFDEAPNKEVAGEDVVGFENEKADVGAGDIVLALALAALAAPPKPNPEDGAADNVGAANAEGAGVPPNEKPVDGVAARGVVGAKLNADVGVATLPPPDGVPKPNDIVDDQPMT